MAWSKHRWARLSAIVAVDFVAACTGGDPSLTAERQLAPREVLAQTLQIELSPSAGPESPADGPAVWVTPTEIAVGFHDGRLARHVDPAATRDLIGALYDAVGPAPPGPAPPVLDVWIDRRVPSPVFRSVMYTLGRTGHRKFRLLGGTPAQPGGVTVELSPFCANYPPDPPAGPPITELRADLRLRWDDTGLRAWALPRPTNRDPFEFTKLEPPPDAPPTATLLADPVPLQAEPGPDSSLDEAAVRRLIADLCRFNGSPFGVEVEPSTTTTHDELLAIFVASVSAPECRGPWRLGGAGSSPRDEAPSTVDTLRARVLARMNAPTDPP